MGTRSRLRRTMWRRRLHPASGWTRFPVAWGLMVAVWFRSLPWIGVALLAAVTCPFWFPIAKRLDNFMSRAVLGELVWLRTGSPRSKLFLVASGGALAAALVWSLWNRHLGASLALAAACSALWLGHLARCGALPRRHPEVGERVIAEIVTQRPEAAR